LSLNEPEPLRRPASEFSKGADRYAGHECGTGVTDTCIRARGTPKLLMDRRDFFAEVARDAGPGL
jgi:hypothetical protein